MTEEEWLGATETRQMLELVREKGSDRKCRLFSVACCQEYRDRLTDERSRNAVDVAERYADGGASEEELRLAETSAREAARSLNEHYSFAGAAAEAASHRVQPPEHGWAGGSTVDWYMYSKYWEAVSEFIAWFSHLSFEQYPPMSRHHCDLLREIFGNPFQPVAFDSAWRTSDVMLLARGSYEEKAFDRMPILADALQDAGCTSADVLNHLRDPHATHVRGCWALDRVLEKE
jgi:hypothetical protein